MGTVTMGFGPISDVVGFSHRDGKTHLELVDNIRRTLNQLIAQYNTLPQYVRNLQTDWNEAFSGFVSTVTVSITEYNTLIDTLNARLAQLAVFTTTDTNYTL